MNHRKISYRYCATCDKITIFSMERINNSQCTICNNRFGTGMIPTRIIKEIRKTIKQKFNNGVKNINDIIKIFDEKIYDQKMSEDAKNGEDKYTKT